MWMHHKETNQNFMTSYQLEVSSPTNCASIPSHTTQEEGATHISKYGEKDKNSGLMKTIKINYNNPEFLLLPYSQLIGIRYPSTPFIFIKR